jgi:hypothetical protein
MGKSDDAKLAKLIRKNMAKVETKKKKVQRTYDDTLPPALEDDDLARQDFFSEMKKREF